MGQRREGFSLGATVEFFSGFGRRWWYLHYVCCVDVLMFGKVKEDGVGKGLAASWVVDKD